MAGARCSTRGRSAPTPTAAILSVATAPLTITAANVAKSYGQTPALAAFTSLGLQNGETIGSVAETSLGAAATAGIGPYAITTSGATGGSFAATNYAISYLTGILSVADAAKSYGQTPALDAFTPLGLQSGETIGSVAETSPSAAATARIGDGPYAITASATTGGSFAAANYAINYLTGTPVAEMLGLVLVAPLALKQAGALVITPGTTQLTTGLAEAPSNSDTMPDHLREQELNP